MHISTQHTITCKQLSKLGQTTKWHVNTQAPVGVQISLRYSTLKCTRLISSGYPGRDSGQQQLPYWTWHSWLESSYIYRQITISTTSSHKMQRRLTPCECPVLQDIDGDDAAVLSHDWLLPTQELVTALTDFIPSETVKSCRVQLFEVTRGIYSEAIGDGEQPHTVPLRLKARRGATARASCARDPIKLFTYICGLLPHFPCNTLVAQNHLLMTQLESQPIQQSTSSPPQSDCNTLDSHQSNTERRSPVTHMLIYPWYLVHR